MSAVHAEPHDVVGELIYGPGPSVKLFVSRLLTFCIIELQRIRHDRTELLTRAVQPLLWLVVFGETFTRLHSVPTGRVPYLDFLTPGILAQSGMFIAIFYGIQIIWERDSGVLTKLLVTPTPRSAIVLGKAFAAGIRSIAQVVMVFSLATVLGVSLSLSPIAIFETVVYVVLGAGFFSCLSMTVAGIVLKRERLLGIGQMMTMPFFFASSALYPVAVMPGWLRVLSKVNPLTYEVDALRGILIGAHAHLAIDFAVLSGALVVGVLAAAALVERLVR